MERVIITGADGFVGSYTVNCFLEQGKEVLALDIVDKPNRLTANEKLTYKKLDVTDIDKFKSSIKPDYYDTFVHFAWAGSAGPQRVDYTLQMKNAIDTVEIMKAAKEVGCQRFVCAGSIMEKEVAAAIEAQGSRPGMAYIYGMGKMIAHAMCKSVAADIGIDLLWPMITNAYGVGEFSPRFVNTTIRKIINKEPLQFTSGVQSYDFVYVSDVAKAFYLVAEKGKPFCEYIIGSGDAKPLKEFIIEMTSALDKSNPPLFGDVPFTGTNMPLSVFDISDLKNDTGYKPEISFAKGTQMTMDWLKTI